MKKNLLLTVSALSASALVVATALVACSGDDNNTTSGTPD